MAFISESMQQKLDASPEAQDPYGETVYTLQLKKKARQAYLRKLMQQGGYDEVLQNTRIAPERLSEEEL